MRQAMLPGYSVPLSPRRDREPGDEAAMALCRAGGWPGGLGRPVRAAASRPRLGAGQQDSAAVHERVMALFDEQTITTAWTGRSKLELPEVPGEERTTSRRSGPGPASASSSHTRPRTCGPSSEYRIQTV